jgi:L-malate glycosyltransferase
MKHRILLMARELHHGGSERQLTEIALALDRTQFEPHIAAFRVEGVRAEELRNAGVPLAHIPVRSFRSPSALAAMWKLARYIRAQQIELVHTFDIPLTASGIPLTQLLTSAVALASQRCHLDLIPSRTRTMLMLSHRLADAVVVNCEFLRKHLIEDAGIPAGKIHVCRNGIDLTRFHRGPRTLPDGFPPDAIVIGVVCVLRPEKGLHTLLEAFAKVRPLTPNLRLVIVGSGPMLATLQKYSRELGIQDSCRFEPSTARVQEWLWNMDIFVLPSLSEALSNSLMEAMACGCCVIASRVGGNPELIEDGVRGLLFQPGDAAGLAGVLRTAILNVELRKRLADAGHAFLQAGFSSATSAQRMAGIYTKLLASRKAGRAQKNTY